MPACPNCDERVEKGTANKRKVRGIWVHKECPKKRIERMRKRKHLAGVEGIR